MRESETESLRSQNSTKSRTKNLKNKRRKIETSAARRLSLEGCFADPDCTVGVTLVPSRLKILVG